MPRPGSAAEVRIVEAGHLLTTTIPETSPRYPASPAPSSHGHALAKVQRDMDEGREELNYSEWSRRQEGEESAETLREGSMPPRSYLIEDPRG